MYRGGKVYSFVDWLVVVGNRWRRIETLAVA
jgi:hypothetical protein